MKCVKITFQVKLLGRSRVPCWSTYHMKTTCSKHYYPVDINVLLPYVKSTNKVWVLTCHSIAFKTSVKWGMYNLNGLMVIFSLYFDVENVQKSSGQHYNNNTMTRKARVETRNVTYKQSFLTVHHKFSKLI